jgi:hypothetical protein
MDKDIHYYCVCVLAKAAGFSEADALTFGYASQYVDDSTESEPIQVGELLFDTVRTAYAGLKAYDWSVQKRIFIPFHFIPPQPISPSDAPFEFVTQADSPFARRILAEARRGADDLLRLCRIGIAIHAYADTWAHQGFSGRYHDEKDVENIRVLRGGGWEHLFLENIYLDVLPEIGHAEASHFPDLPFLEWECERPSAARPLKRRNADAFFAAAKAVYAWLSRIGKTKPGARTPWGEIAEPIRGLLAVEEYDAERRCQLWRDRFGGMFPRQPLAYDRLAWRNDALEPANPSDTDWDASKPSDFGRLKFDMKRGFFKSPWVQFHRAALRQRHFVLENLL